MKNLETRRSIRKYSDKPVSDELLTRLFTLAERTQTMGNLQLYSVVVTRDEKMKQQLAGPFQPANGHRRPSGTHRMCRLPPHVAMGRKPLCHTGLR